MHWKRNLLILLCSVLLTSAQATPLRFVLWLHGMQSNEDTWNTIHVDTHVALEEAPVVFGGSLVANVFSGGRSIFDSRDLFGVYHLRLRFGSEELSHGAIPGLLGDQPSSFSPHGDFSSFDTLAGELALAIRRIARDVQGADFTVALVGHSRGGLVARALLQSPKYANESAKVVALVTIGTPHTGSEFGRLYRYLGGTIVNGQTPKLPSWSWVLVLSPVVDLKAPTVGFLAPDSHEMRHLMSGARRLPTNVAYGALVYTGARFGTLYEGIGEVNPFKGLLSAKLGHVVFWFCPPLEPAAKSYLLRGSKMAQLTGDGIVPEQRQKFPAGVNANTNVRRLPHVLHASETSREDDILRKLTETVGWWSH